MLLPPQVFLIVRDVLASDAGIRWGYVFGSCARGMSYRDVDVAIMPVETALKGGVEWGALLSRLEVALKVPVDLVDLRSAPLPLVGPLLEERIVVMDREPMERHEWEAETTSRWLDLRPALERFSRVRRDALEQRLRGAS